MKNKSTVVLGTILFLLLGLLLALMMGWIHSPVSLLPPGIKSVSSTINENQSAPKVDLIKRAPNSTYEEAMKDGDSYFQKDDFTDALEEYIHASQLEKSRMEPYEKIGECYLALDNWDKAYENFTFILKQDPNNETAKLSLAKTYIKKSDFTNALELLLVINPENQEGRYYTGLLRAQFGDLEKAQNNLLKAQSLDPESDIGKKAQNTLSNIQEFNLFTDGKNIHLRTLLARSFIQNQEYQLAIAMLKDVLKENKNYRDAWVLLGFSYYLLGKYDLALETLNNAYDLDPEKPETQYFLGLTHTKLNNNDKALTYLLLALKNDFQPRSDVQRKIADLYLTLNKFNDALSYYLDIIREGQLLDINMYVRPIWIYIDIKKQPIEALKLAQQALQRFPDSAMGYNMVGWAALANDDLITAQQNLDEAFKRDPNLQAVYLNLGDLYRKKNDIEKAKEYYKKAYFMDKNSSIGSSAAAKYNALGQQ